MVISATFVVLLAVPPVERQKLVLTLLELLALIGGLMMPIPITLLTHKMDGVPVMELEEGDKWSRLPSRDDMMFALIAMNFVVLTLVVFISVVCLSVPSMALTSRGPEDRRRILAVRGHGRGTRPGPGQLIERRLGRAPPLHGRNIVI